MIRMQVDLTEQEQAALDALVKATGKDRGQLIRDAVGRLIQQSGTPRRVAALERAAGLWKDRTDLPDFRSLRSQWDRG
jgi:metal-responsive CopG/Arc/MetJ family transcriptional regulator